MTSRAREIAEKINHDAIDDHELVNMIANALLQYGQEEREKALNEAVFICHGEETAWEAEEHILSLLKKEDSK